MVMTLIEFDAVDVREIVYVYVCGQVHKFDSRGRTAGDIMNELGPGRLLHRGIVIYRNVPLVVGRTYLFESFKKK